MEEFTTPSPDGARACTLFLQGEGRQGHSWYGCALVHGGRTQGVITARIFSAEALWSPDSRYLALAEWLSTDERTGPDMRLFVVDLAESRAHSCGRARGGFVTVLRFAGDLLVYERQWCGPSERREEVELDVVRIASWESLEILS